MIHRRLFVRPLTVSLLCMFLFSPTKSWISRLSPKSSGLVTISMSTSERLVVVIAGPTGVGKSDVATRLCQSRKGMLVSADSVQAFRGVQIGANKPTEEERNETPHLLIDVVDSSETYNVAEWQRDALFSIQTLLQEDAHPTSARQEEISATIVKARKDKCYDADEPLLPVVVGGTMLYVQWLVHGRPDAMRPSEDTVEKAARIMEEYQRQSQWDEAVEFVSSMGKAFDVRTQQLCGQDWYRLRRTLEIAYTVQEYNELELPERLFTGEREGGLESWGYDVRCFFLCPDDRMKHTEVVDRRCEDMLLRGLLKETADLKLEGKLPDMAAKAIGYRQTLDYLQRENFTAKDFNALDAYLNDFTTATRRYAKKQMQWFRKDGSFVFVPVGLANTKEDRVRWASERIEQLCSIPRDEYEQELQSTKNDGSLTVSEQTKRANEEQGKKMKFYHFQRHLIKPQSAALEQVMAEADECTRRIESQSLEPSGSGQ